MNQNEDVDEVIRKDSKQPSLFRKLSKAKMVFSDSETEEINLSFDQDSMIPQEKNLSEGADSTDGGIEESMS